jgi:integrase
LPTTFDVRIWQPRVFKGVKKTTYNLRWIVGSKTHTKTFATKALAESFRSALNVAARNGEAFDIDSGLPLSMERANRDRWSVYSRAVDFCAVKWSKLAPKSREQVADAVATIVAAAVTTDRGRPEAAALRLTLTHWAFNTNARTASVEPPEEHADTIAWIARNSVPMDQLEETAMLRQVLDAIGLRLDGKSAAATTYNRKRMILHQFLDYAREQGDVRGNPLVGVKARAPYVAKGVDPRSVVNPTQGAALLVAVREVDATGAQLEAFFALMLLAGLRTAEAIDIRDVDLRLPTLRKPIDDYTEAELEKIELWGELWVSQSNPQPGRCWTDDGGRGKSKSLKHRAEGEGRVAPCCPELTIILLRHLAHHGTAPDGRLFYSRSLPGGMVTKTTYMRVFRVARKSALGDLVGTPLSARPYDLRHAFISTALAAGVPAADIARWVGQSIEVLMKYYAAMLYGGGKASREKYRRELQAWAPEPDKSASDGPDTASAQVDGAESDAT